MRAGIYIISHLFKDAPSLGPNCISRYNKQTRNVSGLTHGSLFFAYINAAVCRWVIQGISLPVGNSGTQAPSIIWNMKLPLYYLDYDSSGRLGDPGTFHYLEHEASVTLSEIWLQWTTPGPRHLPLSGKWSFWNCPKRERQCVILSSLSSSLDVEWHLWHTVFAYWPN